MKTLLLILSIAIFASCSTAYKSGQTPDDVYYAKPKIQLESKTNYERNAGRYDENYEDRQIRMAIRNQRWRSLDYNNDYNCKYNPYNYGYNYGYYYNPYYYPYPVYSGGITFVNPKNTTVRTTNLSTYNNTITTYTPSKSNGTVKTVSTRRYYDSNNPPPSRSSNTENRSTNTESRTYNPPASNSGSSSTPAKGTSVPMPGRGN